MNTELRKRFEEAAKKCVSSDKMLTYEEGTGALIGFMWGAELGYKEAIAQAKEWMKENARHYSNTVIGRKAMIYDFETDMNKLWEEQK